MTMIRNTHTPTDLVQGWCFNEQHPDLAIERIVARADRRDRAADERDQRESRDSTWAEYQHWLLHRQMDRMAREMEHLAVMLMPGFQAFGRSLKQLRIDLGIRFDGDRRRSAMRTAYHRRKR